MARRKQEETPQTSISFNTKDQSYHAYIRMKGTDGRSKPVHRMSKDPKKLVKKLLKLEKIRDKGLPMPDGDMLSWQEWLNFWVTNVAPLTAGDNTLRGTYGFAINNYLTPRLGGHDVDELTTAMFNDLYLQCQREGLSAKSISHIHTTAKASLNVAKTYGYVGENVAKAATPPTVHANSPEAFDDDELARIIVVLLPRRTRVRWFMRLLGNRQGEVLGLRWSDIDRATGLVKVRGQLQRKTYRHGCPDPAACAKQRCRLKPCEGPWEHGCVDPAECAAPSCNRILYPSELNREKSSTRKSAHKPCQPGCTSHARTCPDRKRGACKRHRPCAPCPEGCVGHAVKCPQRQGGLVFVEPQKPIPIEGPPNRRGRRRDKNKRLSTKTEAGTRKMALPKFLLDDLTEHARLQKIDKKRAGNRWDDNNLVFCTGFGKPIDPKRDWEEWEQILSEARVEYREPHVARRMSALLMLLLKVDRRVIMAFHGWESEDMLKTYQDVPDSLLIDAARQVGVRLQDLSTEMSTGRQLKALPGLTIDGETVRE